MASGEGQGVSNIIPLIWEDLHVVTKKVLRKDPGFLKKIKNSIRYGSAREGDLRYGALVFSSPLTFLPRMPPPPSRLYADVSDALRFTSLRYTSQNRFWGFLMMKG